LIGGSGPYTAGVLLAATSVEEMEVADRAATLHRAHRG